MWSVLNIFGLGPLYSMFFWYCMVNVAGNILLNLLLNQLGLAESYYGFWFLNSVRRIRLNTSKFRLEIGKVKLTWNQTPSNTNHSRLALEVSDIKLTIKNKFEFGGNESSSNTNVLALPSYHQWFLPFQIRAHGITVMIGERCHYSDMVHAAFNLKHKLDVNIQVYNLSEVSDKQGFVLKNFSFSLVADLKDNQISNWKTYIKMSHGNFIYEPAQSKEATPRVIRPGKWRKLISILETLNVLDVKIENIAVTSGHFKVSLSNMVFYVKAIHEYRHGLVDVDGKLCTSHECIFSMNSFGVYLFGKKMVQIPVFNITTTSHLLTTLQELGLIPCDVTYSDFSTTVSSVDPSFFLNVKQLEYLLALIDNKGNPKPLKTKKFSDIRPIDRVIKGLTSNLVFRFSLDDDNHFVFKNRDVSIAHNQGETILNLNSATLQYFDNSKFDHCSTVVSISKFDWDTFSSREGFIKDVVITLGDSKLMKSFAEIRSLVKKNQSSSSEKTSSKPPVKLVYENVTIIIAGNDYVSQTSSSLGEVSRGANVVLHNGSLVLEGDKATCNLAHFTVNKQCRQFQTAAAEFKSIMMVFSKVTKELQVRGMLMHIWVDIELMWTIFYLKHIWNLFRSIKSSSAERPKLKLDVAIESFIIHGCFPNDLELLFDVNQFKIFPDQKITMNYTKILNKSVYEDIWVLLFDLSNFSYEYDGYHSVASEFIRLTTEYQLRFYTITDNLITTFKSFKQIKEAFIDVTEFKKLEPIAEDAKTVPDIRIQSKKLVINVQDDPFEHQLSLIFRVGLIEQRERLEKLREFERRSNDQCQAHVVRKRKLLEHFSTSWTTRFKKASAVFHKKSIRVPTSDYVRSLYLVEKHGVNNSLLKVTVNDVDFKLSKPSFDNCADFIYKYGKQVPRSMQYSTLIPLHLDLQTSKFEFTLRDYPLPILSFPMARISGDLVFAEQISGHSSVREVFVPFVNDSLPINADSIFGSRITRTLTPVKTFMNLKCQVDSSIPTTITWGKSFSAGLQSVMIWFDFLTKPPIDMSEKIGFWDKVRLLLHGTILFDWLGDSEVHLNIIGSNSPYHVVGEGAGLTFCWKTQAQLLIHPSSDPKEFLKLTAHQFVLGVRNFSSIDPDSLFEKLLMKLCGNVIWTLGLLFEGGELRSIGNIPRDSHFKHHYEVELVNPAISYERGHDSYRGFRSNFIHMSVNVQSKDGYNSVHLSPHMTSHFLAWWSLFGTLTSGPIRQGKLFGESSQNGKKFGKSLYTIKYQIDLSPISFSHLYRHANSTNELKQDNHVAFTGLKGKLSSFKLDLHQRREMLIQTDDTLNLCRRVWKLKMNQGEIDCVNAEFRLISTLFDEEAFEEVLARDLGLVSSSTSSIKDSESKYDSPFTELIANDWFDFDDYVDLRNMPLKSKVPMKLETEILLSTPRISYFRNTETGYSEFMYPFGDENSHNCCMGENHPEDTQEELSRERLLEIQRQLDINKKLLAEQSRASNSSFANIKTLQAQIEELENSRSIIQEVLSDILLSKMDRDDLDGEFDEDFDRRKSFSSLHVPLSRTVSSTVRSFRDMRVNSSGYVRSTFKNRFVFHNIKVKVNQETRKLMTFYIGKVQERSNMSFFMSNKAVSLVEEILANRFKRFKETNFHSQGSNLKYEFDDVDNTKFIEEFEDILRTVTEDEKSVDSYLFKLVSPQIQITSDIASPESCLIVTSRDIEVAIIGIDEKSENDLIIKDSLIENRCGLLLSDAQFYLINKTIYTGEWPPILPLELCYDGSLSVHFADNIIIQKTSMFLNFVKPNPIYYIKSMKTPRRQSVRVGLPKVLIKCDSFQYEQIYSLMEDLFKVDTDEERKIQELSKMLLADEIRQNLSAMSVSLITDLQSQIRHLTRAIDTQGTVWTDDDTRSVVFELQKKSLLLKLLMSALNKNYESMKASKEGVLSTMHWNVTSDQVIWQIQDDQSSFVDIALAHISYSKTEDKNGASSNQIIVGMLQCFNMQENPVYQDLVAPFLEKFDVNSGEPMVVVDWKMSKPIGGIHIVDDLCFNLNPLTIKIDNRTVSKFVDFLFPAFKVAASNSDEHALKTDSSSVSFMTRISHEDAGQNTDISSQYAAPELNEMVERSSKFINMRRVAIMPVVISVSYRGNKGVITNVENLHVKVPMIQYTNKFWSSREFILHVKKDLIKVVLQHTGGIIGNKFIFHTNRKLNEPLKQISNYVSFTPIQALIESHEEDSTAN